MYERLVLIKELLSDSGNIYVHCDYHRNYYIRMILDEVFGANNFKNEILWCYSIGGKGNRFLDESMICFCGIQKVMIIILTENHP